MIVTEVEVNDFIILWNRWPLESSHNVQELFLDAFTANYIRDNKVFRFALQNKFVDPYELWKLTQAGKVHKDSAFC